MDRDLSGSTAESWSRFVIERRGGAASLHIIHHATSRRAPQASIYGDSPGGLLHYRRVDRIRLNARPVPLSVRRNTNLLGKWNKAL